ncbi:MAG: formate dehydrogenase subunit delta [Gammaproteobacteria bacterium]
MNIEHLVQMANQIGQFFQTEPDRAEAVAGIANHLKRFWDPRMRKAIIEHLRDHDGAGLDELTAAGVRRLSEESAR